MSIEGVDASMYLSIKNEILFNGDLSDQAIVCMLVMSQLRSGFDTTTIIPEEIISIVYGSLSESERKDRTIKEGFRELIDKGIITPIESKKNMSRFLTSDLSIGNDNKFILISIDEFNKLKDNFKLLRFFLVVVSTINNSKKVGFNTNEQLAEKSFIDVRTVITYNKILTEREILFIYNEQQFVNGKQSSNTYGRITDKELIIENAKQFYKDMNFSANRTMTGNERRRISRNYNDFLKGSFKGDVEKLKADCKRYNELTPTSKPKDLSVFEEKGSKSARDWISDEEFAILFGEPYPCETSYLH